MERFKQLKLPTLKYRRLHGELMELFKLWLFKYYDSEAVVILNFNTCSMTQGNVYKLQKFTCLYNLRKYSFCSRVVNIWNNLPNEVVEGDTINILKSHCDKYWTNQEIYNFNADLTRTGHLPICTWMFDRQYVGIEEYLRLWELIALDWKFAWSLIVSDLKLNSNLVTQAYCIRIISDS